MVITVLIILIYNSLYNDVPCTNQTECICSVLFWPTAGDHVTFIYDNIGSPVMAAPMIQKEFAKIYFDIWFKIIFIYVDHVPGNRFRWYTSFQYCTFTFLVMLAQTF